MKYFALFFLIWCIPAFAEDISFEASVSSQHIALNEAAQLTLTVNGSKEDIDPINLPTIDGFDAKYIGPSTSIAITNGEYHSERSFAYNLFPSKTGHFQIPSISATIAGKSYSTLPIDVEVVANRPQNAQNSSDEASAAVDDLKNKIFISVSAAQNDAYLNQQVPLSVKLFVNGLPLRDIQLPKLEKNGFTLGEFTHQQGTQVVEGIQYDVIEFKTDVYPSRTGELDIGPAEVEGNVVYKTKTGKRNPFAGTAWDDDDFFKGVFGDSYSARPITITSKPFHLNVSAWPTEGKPQDFSGAVGQFDFTASVSPQEAKVGDPLTLRMNLNGKGNFKNIQLPVFEHQEFKSYDPKIQDGVGTKALEQVIIPASDKITEVPEIRFSYFDPSTKEYKTITQGPFPIKIIAPDPGQEFKAVGFTEISHDKTSLPSQPSQSVLQNLWVKIAGRAVAFAHNIWFWCGVALAMIIAIGVWAWRRYQYRLANDHRFARRRKALGSARKSLEQARNYMHSGNVKEFYALLAKALRDYLADQWHKPSAAITVEMITQEFKVQNIDASYVTQIKSILEQCDLVCFAGTRRDMSQMQNDLTQVQQLIAFFEKKLNASFN